MDKLFFVKTEFYVQRSAEVTELDSFQRQSFLICGSGIVGVFQKAFNISFKADKNA